MNSLDNVEAARTSSLTSKPKKSLLGSFNSIFGSKTSHMSGFHISLDKSPLHKYRPGETVHGWVNLNVQRPMGVTHITICLWGYVQVFKHHSKTTRPLRNTGGRSSIGRGRRWSSEYWGDGFASLFEEEVVLCGEGRLDPGPYHFEFKLDFPHNMKLPSSIDFERGTITYLVSATITRPMGIQATTTDEKKIQFLEIIDIARLSPPKAYTARLDRKDRGGAGKLKRFTSYSSDKTQQTSFISNTTKKDGSTRTVSSERTKQEDVPPSPTAASEHSQSSAGRMASSVLSDAFSSQTSQWHRVDADSQNAPISACVELCKPGGIPGGVVQVMISIQHTKAIRSPYGIIVTLFRQGRVDMHPNLPLGPSDNREKVYEDLYPKSRSGLGGLSLSAAGSSQMWRRDLSQSRKALIVRPDTKTAEIRVPVRIPEDALPSIYSAPGDMISFKYFVEVVIDIQGKLASHERVFPSLNMISTQPSYGFSPGAGPSDDGNEHTLTAYYGNCIDTAPMIRSKFLNLFHPTSDFVVGSVDTTTTSLAKGKGRAIDHGLNQQTTLSSAVTSRTSRQASTSEDWNGHMNGHHQGYNDGSYDYPYYSQDYIYDENYDYYYDPNYPYYEYGYDPYYYQHHDPSMYGQVPVPDTADEEGLSEKERHRRWEERHLPSQPPPEPGNATQDAATPSAPFIPIERDYSALQASVPPHNHVENTPQYTPGPIINDFAPGISGTLDRGGRAHHGTSTGIPHTNGEASTHIPPSDDKQELERRRLQAQASAPGPPAGPSGATSQSRAVEQATAPTAPALPEDENYIIESSHPSDDGQAGGENLPQYER